ncbi:lipopolysaccharide heptosyltransferase I [Paraburkholderia phymatum]|uniref:Lipopolysaccharide heptosyltransferase 1 n=1 Tax=Paraburkholderia phymatum (strain DSM 17167 / CIP 108236 / LMG 21445 / STM815) TaxID=391038 RepID=B2JF73_PARP8|nr:lipopolysaccharide heptosyltransferase I [Paraburkholderia phymatum]ACC71441.1 lipopolysaccharide heptosyltransferase I [Paraburkholderia phymatum STM815]
MAPKRARQAAVQPEKSRNAGIRARAKDRAKIAFLQKHLHAGSPAFPFLSAQKILIVRVSSLGDVVHNMPVVADIRRRHPDAQIDWLVEESFVKLVELVHGVRRAIPVSLRRWRKRILSVDNWREIGAFRRALAAENYDLVIDCQGLIKTAWVAKMARGPLVGLGNRTDGAGYEWPVRFFYDRRVPIEPRTHVVERTRQLVASALGEPAPKPADDIDFGLDTARAALALSEAQLNLPVPYVVFVHATSRDDKQWPDAAWIELGQALVRRGASIVLPWGSDAERATSERLAKEFGAAAIVPPKLSLPAVVGLIDGAAATVGVDTGLVHIAAALKRPTVELYNFATSWRTGGYWSPNVVNLGTAGQPPTLQQVKSALTGFGLL